MGRTRLAGEEPLPAAQPRPFDFPKRPTPATRPEAPDARSRLVHHEPRQPAALPQRPQDLPQRPALGQLLGGHIKQLREGEGWRRG